ncbi:hypothetical protein [Hanstruepera marina]|uniref:hypothetical protein n=1 Tax=Hanstruepera marina TaxID=2873265 RepID=UPI001CA6AC40|nr:hypothetical protein [Hanstruepera marina]
MLQTFLKSGSVQELDRKQMKAVAGGKRMNFTCFCGFVGGPWEELTFTVQANDINDALNQAGPDCGGLGATCSGEIQ